MSRTIIPQCSTFNLGASKGDYSAEGYPGKLAHHAPRGAKGWALGEVATRAWLPLETCSLCFFTCLLKTLMIGMCPTVDF